MPSIPTILPVILNQESHLLTNSDHFPTKSINIFSNTVSNPDHDHDETNSIPQPMSLIKPEHTEQVNIKLTDFYCSQKHRYSPCHIKNSHVKNSCTDKK